MNTTLQIRIDQKTKSAVQKTFHSMGLDLSSGVKLYLNQVIHSKAIPFFVGGADYWTKEKKEEVIQEAKYALKNGKRYATIQEAHHDIFCK